MLKGFVLFFLGVVVGLGQVVFFDYLEQFNYLAFAPTALAIILIWWGISKMKQPALAYA